MKTCIKCRKSKPESEFYPDRSNKRLMPHCKDCAKKLSIEWQRQNRMSKAEQNRQMEVVGGYKMFILNYTKKGEYKYQIVSTNGKSFMTNNSSEFMDKVKGIIRWQK